MITELKQEIANLKLELLKQSTSKVSEQEIIKTPKQTPQTVELEQTNVKIDVIQQKFAEFETMYVQSQQEFITNFRSLDERQKTYINDFEMTIKDIIERSLNRVSRSNLALNEESEPNLPAIKGTDDGRQSVEEIVEQPSDGGVESASSEYSLTDYSLRENEDEIVYPIQEPNEQAPVPQKRRLKINRAVAEEVLYRRLAEVGIDSNAVAVSTKKFNRILKELSEDREVVKKVSSFFLVHNHFCIIFTPTNLPFFQIYKSFPAIRQKLQNEVDRVAKTKLNSTESYSSLSSIDDTHSKSKSTIRKRPKSAKHRTVHDSILKKLISNDIDEHDLQDKMVMAQSALEAHRESIQELLKTTAHAPAPMNLVRGRLSLVDGQKPQISNSDGSDDEAEDGTRGRQRGGVDEIRQNSNNRYNKMPNVTTRRVVFVNLDEDS